MNYTKIDLAEWKRGELFRFYINQMRIVISLTVDLNVTPLVSWCREYGYKFYPCMLWIVSKVINNHDEFKYSWDEDENLIRWNTVSPFYTDFHAEDESFVRIATEYSDSFEEFYVRVMADREKYKDTCGVIGEQMKNTFDASCLPWVRYRHVDMHVFDEGKYLAPVVTWGKFEEECKGTIMPLSMNIHHAVADGFHVSRFFNEVQALIDQFAEKR